MPVAGGPFIQKTGILLNADAANAASYVSGSTVINNVFNPSIYNGTLNGAIAFNALDSKGALVFPATDSYVDFGNIGNLATSWSFQVAVKPVASASYNHTILSYSSGSVSNAITFKLDYSSSNQSVVLSSYSSTGSTAIVHTVTGSVPTGSWSIINAAYGNQVLGMYVNGQPTNYAVTTGSTVAYSTNNKLYLGGSYLVTSSYYTGSIGSLFVYNSDVPNTQLIQNYNAFATRFGLQTSLFFPASVDPDAFRFIEVAQITDPTQAAAVNNLVSGLKTYSLWDKMVAIYPFVGGTAYSHKWNLKNPADSDSAYRITFSGAIIHSSKGVSFDGSSFGDTRFAPFTALTNPTQSNHLSVYISGSGGLGGGTNTSAGNTDALEGGMGIGMGLQSKMDAYTQGSISISTSDQPTGLAVVTRTNSTTSAAYVRGSAIRTTIKTAGPGTLRTGTIHIGRNNGGWSGQGPGTVTSFSSIGTGLTTPDVENLYTIVQAFNTSLNRAFNQ